MQGNGIGMEVWIEFVYLYLKCSKPMVAVGICALKEHIHMYIYIYIYIDNRYIDIYI